VTDDDGAITSPELVGLIIATPMSDSCCKHDEFHAKYVPKKLPLSPDEYDGAVSEINEAAGKNCCGPNAKMCQN
jgi:hypothetical protein